MGTNTSAIKRGFHWDAANSRLDFYVNGTKMLSFDSTNNVVRPGADDTTGVGASGIEFKDAYFDGTTNIDEAAISGTCTFGTSSVLVVPRKTAQASLDAAIWVDSATHKIHYYENGQEYYVTASAA